MDFVKKTVGQALNVDRFGFSCPGSKTELIRPGGSARRGFDREIVTMAQPEEARDPSMEEILASIKRIIAEDGTDPNAPPQLSVVSDPEDAAGGDVMPMAADTIDDDLSSGELDTDGGAGDEPAGANTDRPIEDGSIDAPSDSSSVVNVRDNDPLSMEDEDLADDPDSASIAPEPEAAMASEKIESKEVDSRLLSPQADHAVHGAFDQLASTILSDQSRTLEDLVGDMLRPMLQHWLDDNLPVLVERLVREEIERVSRGRR